MDPRNNTILGGFLAVTIALAALFLLSGCVNIEKADIQHAEILAAGWKSQAVSGERANANIEATTTPTTDISAPFTESEPQE